MEKTKAKIAIFSTYPPCRCGIATFSKSLVKVLDDFVKSQVKIIAVSDQKYDYSPRVIFEVQQDKIESYYQAATFVNGSPIEVIILQHEYGIFGGEDGEYILEFLEKVNRPVITVLHSVLEKHLDHRKNLTQRILDLSNNVVVMTKIAKRMLLDNFTISSSKIKVIEHGVPNIRFDEKEAAKEFLGLRDNIVVTTFGLLNPGKGIEYIINALPKVILKFPSISYFVIGITHPKIVKTEGEKYRQKLISMVRKKGLKNHVFFINRYLDYQELVYYLRASDIYLAPQVDLAQSFSGTLSYALGCGCSIISSPTVYAKEILAGNRGTLVEKGDDWSEAILKKLSDPESFKKNSLEAYLYARRMIWPRVGMKYLGLIEANLFSKNEKWLERMPISFDKPLTDYLEQMTTNIGIIQHSKGDKPDLKFGYSLDDQARALIVATRMSLAKMHKVFITYMTKAVDQSEVIHNFLTKIGKYADNSGSEASITRAFWGLSYYFKNAKNKSLKTKVKKLIEIYEKQLPCKGDVRTLSYSLLGYYYLDDKKEVAKFANKILNYYYSSSDKTWHWFECKVTWGNAIIPYALTKAYRLTKKKKFLNVALKTLKFLEKAMMEEGVPSPISHHGWQRDTEKFLYDQQPIEVADMVLLYNELYFTLNDKKFRDKAMRWMGWYYGNNLKEVELINYENKGIHDAITNEGLNPNQGAESIVTYLMAYLSFNDL